jgi:glycosyltransferase involved in cell wall biosynthesis
VGDTRLAVVSDSVLPFHAGGKETRHDEIIRRLTTMGYRIEVHTMRWWDGERDHRRGAVRYRALCRRYRLYRGERRSLVQAVVFAISGVRMLFRSFDVVEVDAVPVIQLFVLRLVTWLRRRPLVVTWHEVWGAAYWRRYLGRLGAVAARLERWALLLPDHIVSPSPGTAARIREIVGPSAAVSVVPNGIDLRAIERVVPDAAACDVIFVGRLIGHKNVDVLIRAVAALAKAGRAVTCRIIGTGPEEGALRQLAHSLGIADRVRFEGRVPRTEEVLSAMKSARVFVSLSEREGFGVAVLEAMACGRPIVAYDHPDNHARELLVDGVNASLVSTLDIETVALAIGQTVVRADELGRAAAEAAHDYDWDAIARQMSKVYRP